MSQRVSQDSQRVGPDGLSVGGDSQRVGYSGQHVTGVNVLLPLVKQTAEYAANRFGVDHDDVFGTLSLEIVEHPHRYLPLYDAGEEGLVFLRLREVAAAYAKKERVYRQVETGQHHYEPRYVRLFLPFYFYREWENVPRDELADRSDWTTSDALDTAVDIDQCMPLLRHWQRNVIFTRHVDKPYEGLKVDWQAIADAIGSASPEAARKQYDRATLDLTTAMNSSRAERTKYHEGPGGRGKLPSANSAGMNL